MARELLDILTEFLDESSYNRKSDDPVAGALEKALDNTSPSHAGTPWDHKPIEPFDDETSLRNELYDRLLGKK